jgi:hypothetical protein
MEEREGGGEESERKREGGRERERERGGGRERRGEMQMQRQRWRWRWRRGLRAVVSRKTEYFLSILPPITLLSTPTLL